MWGYCLGVSGGGWDGLDGGMVGVSRGDLEGEVGLGVGLKEIKKMVFVKVFEIF